MTSASSTLNGGDLNKNHTGRGEIKREEGLKGFSETAKIHNLLLRWSREGWHGGGWTNKRDTGGRKKESLEEQGKRGE